MPNIATDLTNKINGHVPQSVIDELPAIIERYTLTPLRLAHLLSQCDHESGGFKSVAENLNYTKPEILLAVFPKYFKSLDDARDYAGNSMKIGNRVYANRLGNGNEKNGDGFFYRGRGYLQVTGKTNQKLFFKSIGLSEESNPDLIATTYPLTSAAWFFYSNRLWKWCDTGSNPACVKEVTKRINGGLNGIEERQKLFNKYWNLLKGELIQ